MGTWKDFWNKVFSFLSGRMDDKSIRRLMAAFGTFIMLGLGYLTTVITYYLILWISVIVILDALIGLWIGFVGFVGVFVISFFGTTESLSAEDKAVLKLAKALIAKAQADPQAVLADAFAGLASAIIPDDGIDS